MWNTYVYMSNESKIRWGRLCCTHRRNHGKHFCKDISANASEFASHTTQKVVHKFDE